MNITITLDYEIFLNDHVGTVENSLIKPTNRIIEICKKHNIHLTPFVDAAYLYMLNKLRSDNPKLQKDYELVCQNIKDMVANGHDVQLHIHPQWYFCTYDGNDWTMDWEHYKLSDMPEEQAFTLFRDSKELLETIVGHKVTAYRAGGYSIQEFNYQKCFKENGIVADSSVLSGCHLLTATHYYDYRDYPKSPYRFNKLDEPIDKGNFLELPISTKRYNFFKYIILKKIYQRNRTSKYGDGGDNAARLRFDRLTKIKQLFGRPMYVSANFDWIVFRFTEDVVESYREVGCATIISHPKNVSPSSLKYMDQFIGNHIAKGDEFVTITQMI